MCSIRGVQSCNAILATDIIVIDNRYTTKISLRNNFFRRNLVIISAIY